MAMPPQFAKKSAAPMAKGGAPSAPITDAASLKKAIAAVGKVPPPMQPKVKAFIKRKAAALNLSALIPSSWS